MGECGCQGVDNICNDHWREANERASEILRELSDDPWLMHALVLEFDSGMRSEWDCDLSEGLKMFGPIEWAIAARQPEGI